LSRIDMSVRELDFGNSGQGFDRFYIQLEMKQASIGAISSPKTLALGKLG
jgi:hypothetical protein